MAAKRPWIGTSFKMNKIRAEARDFARALVASPLIETANARLFVIPPFTSIADVADLLARTPVTVGAQNMHWAEAGAWTGEVSAAMILDCGARLVEIGHSERRTFFGETDETVAKKTASAVRHGLLALVCIGETRDAYDAGQTAAVLERQVRAALSLVGPESRNAIVFAYEPVWSIGEGGIPADPDFADEQHRLIKALTTAIMGETLDVVYGGSVNPDNCRKLAGKPHIDGLFIGRSAWAASGYLGIVDAVTTSLRAGF
ncbi:triose-phosphate isomerase [Lichenihabitans psoromatis]|uniref:triose-phosphate isomerase n=1 Tax=Lichenihabitans psoromatis TaxID=2528642 RepID=UPI00103586FC|nr:triose-phosphate isomerase [Lichenihabitans psoromatis]